MKTIAAFLSVLLTIAFLVNPLYACGPSYISPVFEYEHAPEDPFANFAAGKIGIIKPTHRRIVLLAAYRYLIGGGFSDAEQKALVEVWNAEFNNQPYESDDVSESVKKWVAARKSVVGKEEKTPEIYVEREYGGYDFFPNCTRSAFETAEQTLSDRVAAHGSEDGAVRDWVKAQDAVFENCASGKRAPDAAEESMPEWLKKDRAYQRAAAEFYSLDYDAAKQHFAEIAQDADSPWQATAEYLVGRTLIRQASLAKDKTKTSLIYTEAEQNLALVAAKGGKFSDSAEKLIGLIKYRTRPQERVHELGNLIASQSGANFRQDLIDYNWLLDKFEKETLEAEDKRKEEAKIREEAANSATIPATVSSNNATNANSSTEQPENEGDLRIYLYSDDYKENWTFYVKPDASDAETLAKAETIVGRPLTEKMKEVVRSARQTAYAERFVQNREPEYQGGYWGAEKLTLSLLPESLRADELTNWLYTFQIQGNEAYLYALSQWRQTNADLWLLTAISKAGKASTELNRLLEAADKIDRNSVAYPTIAYHKARILIEQNKPAEARKLLDDVLTSGIELPVSSRNMFLKQRAALSESLDDFLEFAQLKPFAFDWDGTSGTIDDFIKEQKSAYSPESYPDKTREEYEKEVDENFKNEKLWQNRGMFDSATVELMNQHFPLSVLVEAEKSPSLPEYLRERFAVAVWTRAVLLDDFATAEKISGEVVKYHPRLEELMTKVNLAKTPAGKQRAALYAMIKNPLFTPYLVDGLGRNDEELKPEEMDSFFFEVDDWWCAPYDTEYDEATGSEVPRKLPAKPLFLSGMLSTAAQTERQKLTKIGDAPKYLGEKAMQWAALAPTDKRVPESLYITWLANGWTKYGCGNEEELRNRIGVHLKKKFPQNEWTQKIIDQEKNEN